MFIIDALAKAHTHRHGNRNTKTGKKTNVDLQKGRKTERRGKNRKLDPQTERKTRQDDDPYICLVRVLPEHLEGPPIGLAYE